MMDPPFDGYANVRRLIRLLAEAYEARLDGLNQRATHTLFWVYITGEASQLSKRWVQES
jgi:hypothetical protein